MKCKRLERIRPTLPWSFSSIADESAAEVGRENLRGRKVLAREGALARPGGADEDDKAQKLGTGNFSRRLEMD